jgi:hypothetical protein
MLCFFCNSSIGLNTRTLQTHGQSSFHLNQYQPKHISMIEFGIESKTNNRMKQILLINFLFHLLDDEENQTCHKLAPIHIPNLVNPSQTSQSDQLNLNNNIVHPMSSNLMSPSTAVRSIFVDLLQQCKPNSPPHPKTNKRMIIEGKFGEEITSSNILNELKEKLLKPNPKKRSFESNNRLVHNLQQVVVVQLLPFRTLSFGNTVSDQNDSHSLLETQQ